MIDQKQPSQPAEVSSEEVAGGEAMKPADIELTDDEERHGFTTIDHPNPETEHIEEEGEPFGANFA